ncbi:bifunctional phosphopantothenoylcysteine decarboxylase/phosphopantothenate--cysteine ligase CoaBC [Nostocoides sp. F2B08]|uniref:bifunctional phosphopantothenoylcysteine decarboxylase/phosphopantothenate--cysteine ligase CoaBC n=1 Tax=Nostocoides sp. F2B08 TaxID=2653936 RepID=UPI00126345D1|nr:bifunctional phosphopantothenoylcysteine decarboxylase/phosphopantothenate--cysteine ligase CoaBC [Tetrasphaera sp. F2B08]KAB7744594.1 bifunctional phosphopantothenoylcysteine decarboxylase/phosphopantothenate--cysteine ligase CoaBC [Tetrasphaera sp. F2B08]
MRVVLGVSGGIAAYKAALLLRLLSEAGHEVTVVPTAAALRFVGEPTWAALSGRPVATDVWTDVHEVPHVRLGQSADLVVVAPATADLLARAAAGMADDLLTNTLLTARCPVVMAPAMHTEMWEHPATQANVETLTQRGVHVVPPAAGRLTGADSGPGRLPEPEHLFEVCQRELARADRVTRTSGARQDLVGTRVLVTAGGTREPLDPVRFLGNRSSGKQGVALAAAARRRGAIVTLVLAHAEVPPPPDVEVVRAGSALELAAATRAALPSHDVVVMAAAVADFRPDAYVETKIKKSYDTEDEEPGPTIRLVRNPDILAGLVAERGEATDPLIVGFAAETGDEDGTVLEHGRTKLERKGCDLLVVNEVGIDKAFGQDENSVVILRRGVENPVAEVGPAGKAAIADAVLDAILDARRRRG